jgi:alkylation response protein AidB-like acyl-CoA dehydrogenase
LGDALPAIAPNEREELDKSLAGLRAFLDKHLDPTAIDRQADIPRNVIDGLARLGVYGMTAPEGHRGKRFFADGLLQGDGRDRQPLRFDVHLRQRSTLHWHAGVAAVRHAGTAAPVAAAAHHRRESWPPSP